jgi:glycosyltransferase involved in cell wall biosynthesis
VRVGVDGRSLVGGTARGVAHYTSALLGALAAAFPEDEYRVLLPRGPVGRLPPGVVPVRHALPGRVLFGAAALARRPRLDRLVGGCDVVWAPAPAPLAVGSTPLVLTIHDRSWEARPHDFTPYERAWHAVARPRALARRAARIMCGTRAVRAEIVAAWGLAADRVRVVPPAAVPPAATNGAMPAQARPFLLFVGALEPRKGPDVLGAAFRRARASGLAADLVVVGTGRLAAVVQGPGVHMAGHVGRAELTALYGQALALVLPSRLEGFGMVAVEALAAGTPVIASDLPPVREVLGPGGARFVAPGDACGLAAAMRELAGDDDERARLAAAGARASSAFDWAASARAARAVFAEAAR